MDEDSKKKPGPDPERLVIEGDPEEALGRLLGKRSAPGEWRELTEAGEPDHRRAVEYEDEEGNRWPSQPGEVEAVLTTPREDQPQAVRWRYLDK